MFLRRCGRRKGRKTAMQAIQKSDARTRNGDARLRNTLQGDLEGVSRVLTAMQGATVADARVVEVDLNVAVGRLDRAVVDAG